MTLYEECLKNLSCYRELTEDQSIEALNLITQKIDFAFYDNIDWSKISNKREIRSFDQLVDIMQEEVYLFWDNGDYPVLISFLNNIVNAWDDVEALGTKMWIVSIKLDFFLEYQHETLLLGYR